MFPLRGYIVPDPLGPQTNTNKLKMSTGKISLAAAFHFRIAKHPYRSVMCGVNVALYAFFLTGKSWKGASMVAFFLPIITVHGLGE